MKTKIKHMFFLFSFLLFLSFIIDSCAEEIITKSVIYVNAKSNKAIMPKELREIGEGAFEGTNFSTIELQSSIDKIDNNAFANIQSLRKITIPNNISFIGDDAFKGSNQVVITGAPKSYARAWAEKKGIPFSPIDSFYAFDNGGQITGNLIVKIQSPKFVLDDDAIPDNEKLKQTGRLSSDIIASRYMEFTAFHIRGRSPPLA